MTYPLRFDTYRWYKPLLTALLAAVYAALLFAGTLLLAASLSVALGIRIPEQGTDAWSALGILIAETIMAELLLGLYLAVRTVRERPFSSYASSRGGWNRKLFGRCLGISFTLCLAVFGAGALLSGQPLIRAFKSQPATLLLIVLLAPAGGICSAFLHGFIGQAFGAWTGKPVIGVTAAALAGVLYSLGGLDPARIALLAVSLCCAFLILKTKGVEAAGAFWAAQFAADALMTGPGPQAAGVNLVPAVCAAAASVLYTVFIVCFAGGKLSGLQEAEKSTGKPETRSSAQSGKKTRKHRK